jgi:molybdopterin synthase sulfur carrier subunit
VIRRKEKKINMPTFQILYFASASSYTGKSSESLPAPLPLSQLFPLLEERYPGITEKVLSSCSVSVGLEYVDIPDGPAGKVEGEEGGERVIGEGEEVAIIPPVSSG